eukprot:scaffold45705_cov22-Prasinocladus_malaysianus.AAC.1
MNSTQKEYERSYSQKVRPQEDILACARATHSEFTVQLCQKSLNDLVMTIAQQSAPPGHQSDVVCWTDIFTDVKLSHGCPAEPCAHSSQRICRNA